MSKQTTKKYAVLYAKYCYPKDHKFHWLGHCNILNLIPKKIQSDIEKLSNTINIKYSNDIIVNMDVSTMPGCISTPDVIHNLSKDIYQGMISIIENNYKEVGKVRLVYGIGELPIDWIENNVESAHQIGSFPFMVKLGRTFDKNWEPGIFEINY